MSNAVTHPPVTENPAGLWAVPASYAQERVWFASQLARDVPVYQVVDEFRLPFALPADRIRAALATLCARHETLRTSFRVEDGGLMQVVHAEVDLPLTEVDLTGEPAHVRRQRLDEMLDELGRAEIPLDRAPLWRAVLARCAADVWAVLFVAHHAVVDAASQLTLRAEIKEICAAEVRGTPAELPELPIQYADYAVWQRGWLSGGRMEKLLAFWRETLAGVPVVHGVPTDRARPVERSFAGDDLVFPLPEGATGAVAELARQRAATPFMVLFGAYAALLHRLSGQHDLVIGLPVAGREPPEVLPLVGMFVNMVAIRVDLSGDPTFAELLGRVRASLLAAWDHQDMPFQKLVEALATRREPGVPPLYQLAFNYISLGFSRRTASTEDDLMLEICNDEARLEYNTALFERGTAEKIAAGYQRVLCAVLAQPSVRLSALDVQPPASGPGGTADAAGAAGAAVPAAPGLAGAADTAEDAGYLAPRTAAEELVAAVWSDVLGVPRVGVLDDFFDLGGHSLLALRVIARLSAAAQVDFTIQAFFADSTVAGVASELERILLAEIEELDETETERLPTGEGPPA